MLRWIVIGVVVWATATIVLRLTDIFALPPGLSWRWVMWALAAVPLLGGACWLALRARAREDRMLVAIGIVAPGMAADAIVTLFYADVFPLADPGSASAFGALMLWGYAVVLLTAAVMRSRTNRP